ncbi:glycoside hydrolase family 92 protein [bacterium]|nr:glycoside hydrolase family 92 protein [bacterium]
MKALRNSLALLPFALVLPLAADPLALADPRVGTAVYDGGSMYPGAALPFSMVKLSPDTTKPSTAGYNPTEPILGFSHTHIGGTGGKAFGGQIRVRPQTGPLVVAPPPSPKQNETAAPGYYAVDLTLDRVHAELTTTERAGFHRYTFPAAAPARILLDASSFIDNTGPRDPAGRSTGCSARFVSDREIEGSSSIVCGFAKLAFTVHFVAVFDQPPTACGAWLDGAAQPGAREITGADKQAAGLYAGFAPGSTVGLRVGISYTSIALARENLKPAAGLDFDQVRARAGEIWRKHFSTITVEGGSEQQQRQFQTALYHSVLTPTDVTGDNGGWATDPKQAVYWDIYTLWDTFRTSNPLLTLIHPDRQSGIIRHLLAAYQKTGWLPDSWVYNKQGIPFQGGSHADNVIADAFVKNLGGFNRNLAYSAVRKNATESNPKASKINIDTGRLEPYFTLGYVPSIVYTGKDAQGRKNEYSSGVSRTLEYACNDFSASQVAAALGHTEDAEIFRKRSLGAYTLFKPDTRFFWGKTATGEWMPDHDPASKVLGWSSAFYEGNAWQYRFSMPHDMQGLIARYGGNQPFLAVLDEYFDRKLHWQGNEPCFLTPWLHVYAGRPDKNVDRVREIMARDFKLSPDGYPGDEDVGAMSAWYLFAAMGFYPNAGQDVYLLASPVFSKITLKLGDSGKTLIIAAPGVTTENKYIQSATLNGKPWNQAWFRHRDIINGAELLLKMGPKPSNWGMKTPPPVITPAL